LDWNNLKTTAQNLIADLSGLGLRGVHWRDEPRDPTWGYGAQIYLRFSAIRQQGIEEEFLEESVNPTDDQIVTMVGRRGLTLSVRCESSVYDVASPQHPQAVLEKIAIRLRRTSTGQRLSEAQAFAISSIETIQYVPYFEQGRQVDCFVLDVQCNATDVDVDDTLGAGDYIDEAVIGPSDVKDTDSNILQTVMLDVDSDPTPGDSD
jgi:hypothetical protein